MIFVCLRPTARFWRVGLLDGGRPSTSWCCGLVAYSGRWLDLLTDTVHAFGFAFHPASTAVVRVVLDVGFTTIDVNATVAVGVADHTLSITVPIAATGDDVVARALATTTATVVGVPPPVSAFGIADFKILIRGSIAGFLAVPKGAELADFTSKSTLAAVVQIPACIDTGALTRELVFRARARPSITPRFTGASVLANPAVRVVVERVDAGTVAEDPPLTALEFLGGRA